MKVYCVFHYDYDGYHLYDIFDSLEKAQKCVQEWEDRDTQEELNMHNGCKEFDPCWEPMSFEEAKANAQASDWYRVVEKEVK
jgi:hypothetical protein